MPIVDRGIGAELVREALTTAWKAGLLQDHAHAIQDRRLRYERFGFCQHDIAMRLDLKEQLYEKE